MLASVSVRVAVVALNVCVFADGQLELINGHGLALVARDRWAVIFGNLASNAFVLYHVNVLWSSSDPDRTHLEASASNEASLAERVGAGEATEVQPTILVNVLSAVQSAPVEARLLLVSTLVVSVGRAVERRGSCEVESGCSLLNSQGKGKKSS